MPPVIAKAVFYLAYTWGGGYGAAAAFFLKVATSVVLSMASSRLFAPKIPDGAGLSGKSTTRRSALEYRKLVYGQAMVSGPVVYINLSGTDGEFLWNVIALAQGSSEDLVAIWLDNYEIPKAEISWTAGTGASDGTGTGEVSTARWVGDNSTGAVNAFYYLGDDAQPVCGALNGAFVDIDNNHRLRGVTYLVTKFLYNEDTENVWKEGVPRNIKALIKGRKLYDPRLDSTQIIAVDRDTVADLLLLQTGDQLGLQADVDSAIEMSSYTVTYGSGSHRIGSPSTWEWSDNPALCVADYLLNVMGVSATYIDWPSIADGADDCDVLVAIPPSASPENTEKRFTCNGAVSLGDSHKDNLDVLLSSCDGMLSYSSGTWVFRASVWEESSVSFDEDDLAGDIVVRGSAPKSDRFNMVRGFFVDPDRKYESVEFPHVKDSAYLTRDNGQEISADLQLPMTNSETMCQRIAFRRLSQSDNQIICEAKLNARGAKVAVGDVVSLTVSELSWSSKTFRCIEWARNADGTFGVALQEDTSDSYSDPIVGDYNATNTGGVTVPSEVVPEPSNLTATGIPLGVQLTWTNPPSATYDAIDVYEHTSNTWGSPIPTKVSSLSSGTDSVTIPHESGTYYYWIRAVRLPDAESVRNPDSDTSTVSATVLPAVDSMGDVVDFSVTATDVGATQYGGFRVDADGDIYRRQGGSGSTYSSIQTWKGSGDATDYEVKVTKPNTSDDDPDSINAGLGTWLGCGTDRTWEWESVSGADAEAADLIVSWRRTSDNAIVASINVAVTVTYI